MGRPLRAIAALALFAAGLSGCVVVLTGQGLDRAEKWVSLVGMFISVIIGLAGLALGWLTWLQSRASSSSERRINAQGSGAVALGGDNAAEISTDVLSAADPGASPQSADGGVTAGGAGSVAIGGSSAAPIHTKITRAEGSQSTQ